jgi:hypothetical protein
MKALHCKKKVTDFLLPSLDVTNQVWLVTSRLGTGKTITFFTVYSQKDSQPLQYPFIYLMDFRSGTISHIDD